MNNNSHLKKCSIDDLMRDINNTKDPIRKTILKKFIDLKIRDLKIKKEELTDDISLVTDDDNGEKDEKDEKDEKENTKQLSEEDEIMNILKKQKQNLTDLDNIQKMKAYTDILAENTKDNDIDEIEKLRGKTERVWVKPMDNDKYDPKYIKYVKEDMLNNKMMERLNSEIDFRHDEDNSRIQIEKPFDDGELDATEQFAKYEKEKVKFPKKNQIQTQKQTQKTGIRKSFYR